METKNVTENQTVAAVAAPAPVATNTFYPYAPVVLGNGSSFLAYTGTPVEQAATATAPANASVWRPHSTGPGIKSYFDGTGWTIGPDVSTLTLAQLQGMSLAKASSDFNTAVDELNAGYPSAERSSWQQQVSDAQTVLNGGAASALLSSLATARSTDVKDLAAKIVAKNEAYTAAYSAALASFQKTRATISSATEIAQLPPLTVEDIVFAM
jgi:hypothetical protein